MLFVQYGITAITILLLLHDNLKVLDKFSEHQKKFTFYGLIGILFILSIINIVSDEMEQSKLMTQVEETYEKTKTIVDDVGESLKVIKDAKDEIVLVDSAINIVKSDMSAQVKLLDSAVIKSKEMLKLNRLEFEMGKPTTVVASNEVTIVLDTIDDKEGKLIISTKVRNSGIRTAVNLHYTSLLIIELASEEFDLKQESKSEPIFIGNLIGNLKMDFSTKVSLGIKDLVGFNNVANQLFYIIKYNYIDGITGEPYTERHIFVVPGYGEGDFLAFNAGQIAISTCDSVIMSNKLYDFLD